MLRLALVSFDPPSDFLAGWRMPHGDIVVETVNSWERDGKVKVLVVARCPIALAPMTQFTALVDATADMRKRAERSIECCVGILALAEGCRRTIVSPFSPIAFLAESDGEREWLSAIEGRLPRPKIGMAMASRHRFDIQLVPHLSDRIAGVVLLAEAMEHQRAMGRYHDLVRFFECAFARPYRSIEKKLAQFLSRGRLGYTRAEVSGWVGYLRDAATHADRGPLLALEVDVWPLISRMEQAAYDVLLNKQTWGELSAERREIWFPSTATTSPSGDRVQAIAGTSTSYTLEGLDQFDAFPVDVRNGMLKDFPKSWWVPSWFDGQANPAIGRVDSTVTDPDA